MNFLKAVTLVALMVLFTGCESSTNVEVIDLNKVLDIFQATLDELDGNDKEAVAADEIAVANAEGEEAPAAEKQIDAKPGDDQQKMDQFKTLFVKKLNEAKLISTSIGVNMAQNGAIEGFGDSNSNNVKDGLEKQLFTIQIDEERQRVIASDGDGHHRDHHYRPRFGFFTGYMFARMFSGQSNYYSGARAGSKPNFGSMQMSSKDYHSGAVAKAKSKYSSSKSSSYSSKSKTGTRSFSFGK